MLHIKEYQTAEGNWTCDLDITVDEWLSLLRSDEIQDKDYIPVLLKFYREVGHKATCTSLEKKYGRKYNYFNNAVTNFGRWVQKTLNRFEIINENGERIFWMTSMTGKTTGVHFEWTVRPELAEAIHQYLLSDLIEQYKQVVIPKGLGKKGCYELYKWELLTRCQGKDTEYVLNELLRPGINLIDRQYDGSALRTLLQTDKDEILACFNELDPIDFKGSYPKFKEKVDGLMAGRWKYSLGDERMAAAFLACVDPEHNTFYKDEIYANYCHYMGIITKQPHKKYDHYMSLLPEVVEAAKSDEELSLFIQEQTSGLLQSDLLAAQNILWVMKDKIKIKSNPGVKYTWVPFMNELARKLLSYRTRRDELVKLFYGIGHELTKSYQEDGNALDEIIPFDVLGTLAVGSEKRRSIFAEYYQTAFDIKSPIPEDYIGCPSLNSQRVMFVFGSSKAKYSDIFWDLLEKCLNGEDISDAFDKAMRVPGINRNASMALFWIAPDRFLSMDGTNEAYLVHYGFPNIPSKDKINYKYYSGLMPLSSKKSIQKRL